MCVWVLEPIWKFNWPNTNTNIHLIQRRQRIIFHRTQHTHGSSPSLSSLLLLSIQTNTIQVHDTTVRFNIFIHADRARLLNKNQFTLFYHSPVSQHTPSFVWPWIVCVCRFLVFESIWRIYNMCIYTLVGDVAPCKIHSVRISNTVHCVKRSFGNANERRNIKRERDLVCACVYVWCVGDFHRIYTVVYLFFFFFCCFFFVHFRM